jgi:hypoxanthine-DNA glycosylase
MEYETVVHNFEPVFNDNSRILILGSLPSVKSRESNFYYGHPQNRFWKLIAGILCCDVPVSIEEKRRMLIAHGIAIWDVVAKCDIIGSSDTSIKNVVPNDINRILKNSRVIRVYANGKKAAMLYDKFCYESTGVRIRELPSTSPANASYGMAKLAEAWKVITEGN